HPARWRSGAGGAVWIGAISGGDSARRGCGARGPLSAAGRSGVRHGGEYDDVSARRVATDGRVPRYGAWPVDARRGRHLPARRALVSGARGRFYLDGAVLSAMVRRPWKDSGAVSDLQGLEPMKIDGTRLSAELESLAGFSDTPAPSVTRVVFS